jgi:chromosome partitioning protein
MDSPGLNSPRAPGSATPDNAARRGPGGGYRRGPRILVLGNEKGGSGKSTTAMHLIVALLKRGFTVGSIDLDARQGTLSRLLENRADHAKRSGLPLELPEHRRIYRSEADARSAAEWEEKRALESAVTELAHRDFIVMDTPGSDSFLSRAGHACAEILITPMNDSFLDLDLLARIDIEGRQILGPSLYSQMVWEQRQRRAAGGMPPMDWIVMRNRLSHIDARNKREIGRLLELLSERIRFRLAPGFGERVIFRELFPKGLTLLDLREGEGAAPFSMSHVAARQEVRALLRAIGLPEGPGAEGPTHSGAQSGDSLS